MALKTKAESPSLSETTVLELALYQIYTWQFNTYEKGKPYRFRNSDAMILLSEQDLGRPIWRLYRPPLKKQTPKAEIVDATQVVASLPVEEPMFGTLNKEQRRIEIGDDSEIADLLPKDDSSGDVTV